MADAPARILLTVHAGPGTDEETNSELALRLRHQLADFEAARIEHTPSGTAPPGAKGVDFSLASLSLTIAPAATTALFNLLQGWLSRHERASITIESNGQKVTITGQPSVQQQEMVTRLIQSSTRTGAR